MRRIVTPLICFVLIAVANLAMTAHAAGEPERGAALAGACEGCHGISGYRNGYPSYRVPKLGGQYEEYLYIGLQGYQSEGRSHPTMRAQTATLTGQEMRDLAAYYAAQGELEEGSPPTGSQVSRGKEKAVVCSACHGESGISPAPNWPSLAGQHEDYLREVIRQYRTGQRTDPVMVGQVVGLSDDDIEDISAFYAAQPGLFTTD
jgi:cytochrome c553